MLDCDCIPVSLFEVGDVWKEAHLARVSGAPCSGTTSDCAGDPGCNDSLADFDNVPEIGQGLLLVTERNAEINAGYIVLFGSDHSPIITEADWRSIPLIRGEARCQAISKLQGKLVDAYWQLVQKMVANGRNDRDMSREECQAWVQTGLALTPFCGHIMESSLEWAGLVTVIRPKFSSI